ncbi:hypothetical protein O9G_004930, partial [Rozella allomycis CSF55]
MDIKTIEKKVIEKAINELNLSHPFTDVYCTSYLVEDLMVRSLQRRLMYLCGLHFENIVDSEVDKNDYIVKKYYGDDFISKGDIIKVKADYDPLIREFPNRLNEDVVGEDTGADNQDDNKQDIVLLLKLINWFLLVWI